MGAERLSPDSFSEFVEDGSLLNEFAMMWELRERFPLHFIVFKQTVCQLSHEANVEQVFSRAGNLSEPNMDPEYLLTWLCRGKQEVIVSRQLPM